jgi:hypothetical protein
MSNKPMSFAQAMKRLANRVLRDIDASRDVVVGPVVWTPVEDVIALHDDGFNGPFPGIRTLRVEPAKEWYLVVAAASTKGKDGFWLDQYKAGGEDQDTAQQMRAGLIGELARRKLAVNVHQFDDGRKLAAYLETRFPGPRSRKMRVGLEAEHASWRAEANA